MKMLGLTESDFISTHDLVRGRLLRSSALILQDHFNSRPRERPTVRLPMNMCFRQHFNSRPRERPTMELTPILYMWKFQLTTS